VGVSAWERDVRCCQKRVDEHVYRLYLPAPGPRQAGGLTPEETKLVKEAGKR